MDEVEVLVLVLVLLPGLGAPADEDEKGGLPLHSGVAASAAGLLLLIVVGMPDLEEGPLALPPAIAAADDLGVERVLLDEPAEGDMVLLFEHRTSQ